MRVIFISHQDFANFSYEKAESLKSVGVDAEAFIYKKHPFAYGKQATQVDQSRMIKEIAKADLIHVMHSCGTMWDLVKESGKRIMVWHTGTRYRQEPEKHNARWNPIVERSFYALGEFENLGCKNGEYFSVTIDTDLIKYHKATNKKITFGHYPSNPQVKGTQNITRVISEVRGMRKYDFENTFSVRRYQYYKQLQRMMNCDVYLEMCATKQGDKPYGSWGTTALETSALGKPTITNFLWEDCYKKFYGEHKLIIANSPRELKTKIIEILEKSEKEVTQMGIEAREWVIEKHGRKATGERLIKYL